MEQYLALLTVNVEVGDNALVYLIMIKKVVRRRLVVPNGLAGFGFAGKDAGSPLVVARPQLRIPNAGIARAVVDKVGIRVIRNPAPRVAAAELPLLGRPGRDAQVFFVLALFFVFVFLCV
jgi:hypothetical protein